MSTAQSTSRVGASATPLTSVNNAALPTPSIEPARFAPPPASVRTNNPFHVGDGDGVGVSDAVAVRVLRPDGDAHADTDRVREPEEVREMRLLTEAPAVVVCVTHTSRSDENVSTYNNSSCARLPRVRRLIDISCACTLRLGKRSGGGT